MDRGSSSGLGPAIIQALRGAQGSGLFNGSKAPQSESAGSGTTQGSGTPKSISDIAMGPPAPSPIPQFQNPYSSPTITNPYSPEDQRQFGFQIPHQLQMNQQRQQYQPSEPGMSYPGGSRDFYGQYPSSFQQPQLAPSNVGTTGMQKPYTPQRQMTPEQQRMQNIMGIHTPDYYQQPQQFNPYRQQQRPDPYQMYGGLGSLFNMQDAYSQRPAPTTQAQSNEANRRLLEKYKTTAQQPAQQPVQQQPVQQQPYYDTQMYHG